MEVALKCTQELTAFCWSGSSFDVLERQHARQMAPGSWLLCLWYFREASMLRIATKAEQNKALSGCHAFFKAVSLKRGSSTKQVLLLHKERNKTRFESKNKLRPAGQNSF